MISGLLFPYRQLILVAGSVTGPWRLAAARRSDLRYFFEDFSFDTARRELRRGTEVIAIAPQVFDLLDYLIGNRERVVSKDDLIRAIWHGRAVSDVAVTTRMNAARKAIGDSGDQQRLIRTFSSDPSRPTGMSPHSFISISPPRWPISSGSEKRMLPCRRVSPSTPISLLLTSTPVRQPTIRPVSRSARGLPKECERQGYRKGDRRAGLRDKCAFAMPRVERIEEEAACRQLSARSGTSRYLLAGW